MAIGHTGAAWRQVRRLFGAGTVAGLTESELLARYARGRDEAAFASIVALHGPMVLAACRRMLDDPEDVEDAFQATFLVLVRKAGTLGPAVPVGPWLYGVARRVALRLRSESARRRSRERPIGVVGVEAVAPAGGSPPGAELASVLDQELGRLPGTYRAAVVLCDLEGRTHAEAAGQLGWPVGTVKGRLSRARDLLRGRLARRGLAPTAGGLAALMAREAGATVPSAWAESASGVAAGGPASGVVPATASALAEGVIRAMRLNLLKLSVAAIAALLVVAAAGVQAHQAARKDLPDPGGPNPPQVKVQPPPADDPMKGQGAPVQGTPGPKKGDLARRWPGKDLRSAAVLTQLEEPVTMPFPNETPLEDVLKYIRSNTQSEEFGLPAGIPIYVDPVGLQEAKKTLTSPIILDMEGVPLRITLTLLLGQLGLVYRVDEGVLRITGKDSQDVPIAPTPLMILRERAERGELDAAERKAYIEMIKDLREIRALLREGDPTHARPAPGPSGTPKAATK